MGLDLSRHTSCASTDSNAAVSEERSTDPRGKVGVVSQDEMALMVLDGCSPVRGLRLGDAPLVIGRGNGVDLQIKDPTVSRHHCVIWRAAGRCWVRDLGSTNQTLINERAARIAELFDGDVLIVGQTILTLKACRRCDGSLAGDENIGGSS